MQIDKEIELLDKLRIPLLLGVVMIHSNLMSFTPQGISHFPAFNIFMTGWQRILNLMVPSFFFISGYMFFRSGYLNRQSYLSKIKRRLRSIGIPYILWNVIGLLLDTLKALPFFSNGLPQYTQLFDSPLNVIAGFFALPHTGAPYDMPLWFLRNLMIMVLISPLISIAFRYLKTTGVVLFGAICYNIHTFPFSLQNTLWFFSLGAAMPLLEVDLLKFTKNTLLYVIIFASCVVITISNLLVIPAFITQSCGIFMLISLATKFLTNINFSNRARTATFFIYACHGLYAIAIDRILANTISPYLVATPCLSPLGVFAVQSVPFICYIACFVLNTAIAWGLFTLISRLAPKVTAILCGNR